MIFVVLVWLEMETKALLRLHYRLAFPKLCCYRQIAYHLASNNPIAPLSFQRESQ
jgi:hypothetical protein